MKNAYVERPCLPDAFEGYCPTRGKKDFPFVGFFPLAFLRPLFCFPKAMLIGFKYGPKSSPERLPPLSGRDDAAGLSFEAGLFCKRVRSFPS